jgi:hypothetical protein
MNIVKDKGYQTWVTDLQMLAIDAPAGNDILNSALEIAEMLIKKNISYGNSALNPVRIFSKADPKEQLMVRLDDKLSRIKNKESFPGDNDIDDMIGYLVLYKIANNN